MPTKIVVSIISLALCALLIEVASGYTVFQRLFSGQSAALKLIEQASENIEGKRSTQTTHDTSRFGLNQENPFVVYPSSLGKEFDHNINNYRFHPFIDFSGMKKKSGDTEQDYFGFRDNNSENYFSWNRPKSNIFVVMTGGSEAAGYTHSTSIVERIKVQLEQHPAMSGKTISVLNLAMSSYTISNEINAFLNLAWNIKPDFVIAHTGWNDFYYGPRAPKPFQLLGLNYFAGQVEWMSRLYALKDESIVANFDGRYGNSPDEVLMPFISNVEKYKSIVEASGGTFLFGLQGFDPNNTHPENNNSRELIKLASTAAEERGLEVIDFWKNQGWSYADAVHSTDETAELIAAIYVNKILDHLELLN